MHVVEGPIKCRDRHKPGLTGDFFEGHRCVGWISQQTGGVIEKEGGIHVSNVALVDPKDGKPTRIGTEVVDGKRVRVARRSGTRID